MVCSESEWKIHILTANVFTGHERAMNKQTHKDMDSNEFSKPCGYKLSNVTLFKCLKRSQSFVNKTKRLFQE